MNCPKCEAELKELIFDQVCACGIVVYNGGDTVRWEISREENLYLWWHIKNSFCVATFNNKSFSLPWLPYDVTEDRLKLLLTFS